MAMIVPNMLGYIHVMRASAVGPQGLNNPTFQIISSCHLGYLPKASVRVPSASLSNIYFRTGTAAYSDRYGCRPGSIEI